MATAKIANLFNVAAPEQAVVETREPGLCTPAADPHYQFNLLVLKKVMMWLSENAPVKNLFILGDAGTGKTSLILEVAARLGIEVWSMSCSGKTRFNDLVGTLTIAESGATRFVDGPLAAAARSGGGVPRQRDHPDGSRRADAPGGCAGRSCPAHHPGNGGSGHPSSELPRDRHRQ